MKAGGTKKRHRYPGQKFPMLSNYLKFYRIVLVRRAERAEPIYFQTNYRITFRKFQREEY